MSVSIVNQTRGKPLSNEERARVSAFKEMGLSNRQIATKLGRSSCVIDNFVKLGSQYGKNGKYGRTRKLSERTKRLILRKAKCKNMFSSQIQADLKLPVTARRVRQILSEDKNLKFKKRLSKPPLNNAHKKDRMTFAEEHMSWTSEWNKVIFSDEKKFNLDGPDGFQYYWHDLRSEEQVRMSRNFGGGGVMIWAAFCFKGRSNIAWIHTKMNSDFYTEKLLESELIWMYEEFGEDLIFQQDNASIHVSAKSKAWFKKKEIPLLKWPARSPDLNPIENLWGILARRVYRNGRQFGTVTELKNAIREEWASISVEEINTLIKSMPKRIFKVIKNNGGSTKY